MAWEAVLQAQENFQNAEGLEMVEAAVLEWRAAEIRFDELLRRVKEEAGEEFKLRG